ncbi:unnamed protein product [Brachionus calyciflorus]|uniref:glutathione transferase n=1 Tax=Brachionus calyciflorus TaxID=104777 RepID=A0A814M4V9_9BILA|nr:unnamed protein product [Brachionus calyciflorus]
MAFEDERVSNWSGPTKADAPLGQLPYLTVDGVKIPQSLAFARLVAKRFNLAGSGDLEQAKTDAVVDTVSDLQNAYYSVIFGKEDRKSGIEKFLAEDAISHLEKIEKIITLFSSEGYSVGSSLTWSDLYLFEITSTLLGLNSNLLDKYPRIQAVGKTVESHEKIAAYLKSRPQTEF